MTLTQPEIDRYINWLGNMDYFAFGKAVDYEEETLKKADEFFNLIKCATPISENGTRTFWLRAQRGNIEDWTDPKEAVLEGEYKDEEECRKEWLAWFPNETEWYELSAQEDNNCRAIVLRNKCIFFHDQREEPTTFPYDISELLDWFIVEVKECIAMMKDGTYNSFVEKNLPPRQRTGTIVRKHYWDVFPEDREEFFKDLTQDEVEKFCELASAQVKDVDDGDKRVETMTAADFFRCCALGYKANNYEGCELSDKEQYYMHADGRDEGLKYIDPNDPAAFAEWLDNPKRGGGHPWEVCRGGNSTHVSLIVYHDDKGYYMYLSGSSVGRTVETIKFYLALSEAGYPVYISEADLLIERLRETEKIGIVPDGIFPRYCHNMFPGEDIISFMNLPYERIDKLLPFCVWQKEPEVYLCTDRIS